MTTLQFLIAGLACWRLASLAANEDGAFHVFRRFRTWTLRHVATHPRGFLARFHFDEGLHCEWCNSVWFGMGITAGWLYFGGVFIWLACLPLALSAIAIPMKYVIQTLEQVREYYERMNASLKVLENYQPVATNLAAMNAEKYKESATAFTMSQVNHRAEVVAERSKVTA